MGLTIVRWIDTSFMIILYTAICIGELTLRPETVPFENESWELICKADPLSGTVTFNNPLGTVIGFCVTLTESCSPNPGYALAINVTEKTVTMTRTLTSNDNGTWTCSNSGDSKTYVLQSPLLSRNVPQSKTDYFEHSMTALPGITIDTTEADYQFTFNYGCVSANLKFQWTILPGDSWDDTLNTASTALSCSTNQAFKSTKPTSEILSRVTQDGSKLKVSVYVDGYYNLQAVKEYTFNVTFSPSRLTSAIPSSETTAETDSFFSEVTATFDVGISKGQLSFKSTDFMLKSSISLNENTTTSYPISCYSSKELLQATELPNKGYITSEITIDSAILSLKTFTLTNVTIASELIHTDISSTIVTSTASHFQISSEALYDINTGISLQLDFSQSQDLNIPTNIIIGNIQTRYTSPFSSVLLNTKTSTIQPDPFPSTLTTRFDVQSLNTPPLQSSLDSIIVSLGNLDQYVDTLTFSIEAYPSSLDLPFDKYSISQIYSYSSFDSWSDIQTKSVLINTSATGQFTDSAFIFQIDSDIYSLTDIHSLPIESSFVGETYSSVGLFSSFETFSISSFSRPSFSSASHLVNTTISETLPSFVLSSISQTVQSTEILINHVRQSSFLDSFTFGKTDQSLNESIASMVTKSDTQFTTKKDVSVSSHKLSGSQFLKFSGSSSKLFELIATASVNHFTQYDSISETFTYFRVQQSPTKSSYKTGISRVLSANSFAKSLNFQSVETLLLSSYSLIKSYDSTLNEHTLYTSLTHSISTPLDTLIHFSLKTSSESGFAPVTDQRFKPSTVPDNFATPLYDLSSLSSSSTLNISLYTDFSSSSFSEIVLTKTNSNTSDINSIRPSETLYVFSSQPTTSSTQTPALSFRDAQIIIVTCSIAVVILVIFVPLMIMYQWRKLQFANILKEKYVIPEKDSLSSGRVPQVFNIEGVNDYPHMVKYLPVRYHTRSLSDLPYSGDFESNWNSLN